MSVTVVLNWLAALAILCAVVQMQILRERVRSLEIIVWTLLPKDEEDDE